jgi:hypothetical protein
MAEQSPIGAASVGDTVKWDGRSLIAGEMVVRVVESGGKTYAITTGSLWVVEADPAPLAPEEEGTR